MRRFTDSGLVACADEVVHAYGKPFLELSAGECVSRLDGCIEGFFSYEAAHKHARACNGLSYMSGHRGRAKASNPARFVMVTTNCLTGRAEYLEEKQSAARVMDIVRASSSLPYVTKITHVDGVPMLDGGIVDSLPVEYALSQGCERLVVVLTRNKGYRKYPLLQKALQNRNAEYNRVIELIEKLEDEGYAEASKVLSFF